MLQKFDALSFRIHTHTHTILRLRQHSQFGIIMAARIIILFSFYTKLHSLCRDSAARLNVITKVSKYTIWKIMTFCMYCTLPTLLEWHMKFIVTKCLRVKVTMFSTRETSTQRNRTNETLLCNDISQTTHFTMTRHTHTHAHTTICTFIGTCGTIDATHIV